MTTQPMTAKFDDLATNTQPVCEFCGKALKTTIVTVGKKSYTVPCFATCGCEQSRELYVRAERKLTAKLNSNRKYKAAGIGKAYLMATCEPKYIRAVKNGRGLFVYGPIGSGKTYLVSGLAKGIIDDGVSVRFETMVSILRQLQDDFKTHSSDILERCLDCDVLVLDDLGKEKPTEWALSVLFEIVNIRYSNAMPMVVTSNYTPSELIEHLSAGNRATAEAIVSRLYETCDKVRLDTTDRRLA